MNVKLLIFLSLLVGIIAEWSCLNYAGVKVAWFIIFKPPSNNSQDIYYYYDSLMAARNIEHMAVFYNILALEGPLYETLSQMSNTKDGENFVKIAYNDQYGGPKNTKFAHMKGGLFFHDKLGIFFQHSSPNFYADGMANFPESSTTKAQHFYCRTIDETNLYTSAQLLYNIRPYIDEKFIQISEYFLNNPDAIYLKKLNDKEFETEPLFGEYEFKDEPEMNILSQNYFIQDKHLWHRVPKKYDQAFNIVSYWKKPAYAPYTQKLLKNVEEITTNDGTSWSSPMEHGKYALSTGNRICLSDINNDNPNKKKGRCSLLF